MRKATLPRFFKKNRNNLAFFRKTCLLTALKNSNILLFFPTFGFSGSQWLELRRLLFCLVPQARSLASAPIFYNFPPVTFSSTNNHFIIAFPNNAAFLKAAALLLEKETSAWPTIAFFGNACLNLQQGGVLASVHGILSTASPGWASLNGPIASPVFLLNHFFVSYFSYFYFFFISGLFNALAILGHMCFCFTTSSHDH